MISLLNEINYTHETLAFLSNEKKMRKRCFSANGVALINERLCCLFYPWTHSRFRISTSKELSAKVNLPWKLFQNLARVMIQHTESTFYC